MDNIFKTMILIATMLAIMISSSEARLNRNETLERLRKECNHVNTSPIDTSGFSFTTKETFDCGIFNITYVTCSKCMNPVTGEPLNATQYIEIPIEDDKTYFFRSRTLDLTLPIGCICCKKGSEEKCKTHGKKHKKSNRSGGKKHEKRRDI